MDREDNARRRRRHNSHPGRKPGLHHSRRRLQGRCPQGATKQPGGHHPGALPGPRTGTRAGTRTRVRTSLRQRPTAPATGLPAISGTLQKGQTLTADTSGISDADGLTGVAWRYQQFAGGAAIYGATGATYRLVDADVGYAVKVRVNFTDDAGNAESLTSAPTKGVKAAPDQSGDSTDTEDTSSGEEATPQNPPPKPTGLTATVNGDGSITLNWTAPDDDSVTGYQILRRRPQMGETTLAVYVADTESTATAWTDSSVTAGTRQVYRVKAINAAGLSGWSNYVNPTP